MGRRVLGFDLGVSGLQGQILGVIRLRAIVFRGVRLGLEHNFIASTLLVG